MDKTILNIKTDKKVKEEAQKVARELGLPLGTIINAYLRDLVREKRVLFSVPPAPNKRLQVLLKKIQNNNNRKGRKPSKPLTYSEAIEHLNNL
jgi:addiction module RelB/DinJ family antitoxin